VEKDKYQQKILLLDFCDGAFRNEDLNMITKGYLKRIVFLLGIIFFLLRGLCFAHTPLLSVEDNKDGTITVVGGFSTGQDAAGVDILVKSKATAKILWKGKMPEDSQMDIKIPDEPYNVIMDAGPLHVVTKQGPPPPGGFSIVASKEKKETTGDSFGLSTVAVWAVMASIFVFGIPICFLKYRQRKKSTQKD
jgi:hypothetical protein